MNPTKFIHTILSEHAGACICHQHLSDDKMVIASLQLLYNAAL